MLILNKKALKDKCRDRGYKNFADLCEKSGLNPEATAKARDRGRLTVMQLYILSQALNCHMEELLIFS